MSKSDCDAVLRVLRQWQQPWDSMSAVAHVRAFLNAEYWPGQEMAHERGPPERRGAAAEVKDFKTFNALFPSVEAAEKYEPSLAKPLREYRSTGNASELKKARRL